MGRESLSELLFFGALSPFDWKGLISQYTLSMAIFLLSGLVNVILFIAIRPALPMEFVKTGQQLPGGPCDQDQPPRQAITHSRSASDASDSTLVSISKRTKLRPPDIIITRDSFESVYSSYDEERPVARNAAQSAPAMSCWSPDGAPRKRYAVKLLL